MSILDELYYGNIDPSARMIRKGSAYQKCNSELVDSIDKLKCLLDDTLCWKSEDFLSLCDQ
ncbi:MAG: hypothetical protein IJP35_06175 [Clostridia bacterium]|nr:hypothetical protein [Clostridia bacterium]